MKIIKLRKVLILTLFLFSLLILNPLHFIRPQYYHTSDHKPTLSQPESVLRVGTTDLAGDWDPAITDWYNILNTYAQNCLESLFWLPDYSVEPKSNLATDWVFEYWPDQLNAAGFINRGGVKTVSITLREGVKFHDGSDWNATVMKWNIDRVHLINGNYTGAARGNDDWSEEEGSLLGTVRVEDTKPYFTSAWNMSEYDSPNLGLIEPTTPPGVNDYAWYDLGDNHTLVDYPGVNILPNGTVRNPNPYGGWDDVALVAIHWAPYDRFPAIKKVEILDNKVSGGTVKVYYNSWNNDKITGFLDYPMISYAAYKEDYTIHGIYGYENGVKSTNNPTIVDHMIGTGPYIYIEHDETGTPAGGYMVKNENYWNKTALEVEGWFDVDRVEIIKFPAGQLGADAQNIALLTHAIDYTFDSMFQRLDYDAIIANPNINYIESGVSDYITQITLNSINETWWAWPTKDAWRKGAYPLAGSFSADGVPRALRKAMSYAFNYDLYINVVMNGRSVRSGMLGIGNAYYNSSTPLADYNVSKAREILLTTETDTSGEVYNAWNLAEGYNPPNDLYNFSKMTADRGLTASSPDADWVWVAENNPIYTFNFYYDSAHIDVYSVMVSSFKQIGVALVADVSNKVNTIIWDTVRIGHLTTFDGDHSLFSSNGFVMEEHMPHLSPELNIFWGNGDPDRGRWRTLGAAGITSGHYWGNFGFNFDAEVDSWIDRLSYSNQTGKQYLLNRIAEKEQAEIYPKIYISQEKEGRVLWDDWAMNPNRGLLFFANFHLNSPPRAITLSSDSGIPDIDGNFNLNWTTTVWVDNYSIYMSNHSITQINGSLTTIATQNGSSPFAITGLSSDDYYFVVVAYNQYGNNISNNIHVIVIIPGGSTTPTISGYNTLLILGISIFTAVIVFKKKNKKPKLR
ncbi:hypothetical protein LCGC14_1550670 [marine sediment metagenome]|uniref:Solute-binding protein family 5 domain-containing protein n=1 Tax=marine sediment metagenome TaxID=412755 RepID=A0A0F9L6C7_9ZZZZ|nr:hypothetical protein [bacterium]